MTEKMTEGRIRLGQEILRRRKAMGMTQEELASRMGVSRQSVAKWETGQSSPDIDRLALLRDVLQTSLDELIVPAGRDPIPTPAPPAEDSVRPAQAGPVRTFRLLPLILGTLLFCCGLGGLAALWIFSRLHPVRLADWDGSLHTGLEGYLMATGLWPVLLLACILLGCGSLTLLYLWGTRRKDARPCGARTAQATLFHLRLKTADSEDRPAGTRTMPFWPLFSRAFLPGSGRPSNGSPPALSAHVSHLPGWRVRRPGMNHLCRTSRKSPASSETTEVFKVRGL